MFTLYDINNIPMLEIRRRPLSDISVNGGLFDERSCHIRLTNNYCYVNNPIGILQEFLARYDYILIRIFRIDIALDFEKFDKGDEPSKFIQRYIDGRYSKVNQTNISAHGRDEWNGRIWNSVSWGMKKSMVSTKFYCKTLELQQVHDKPYIRNVWWINGLVDNPITCEKKDSKGQLYKPLIWRVEFSIKSSAKKWYIIERSDTRKKNVIAMPHTLDIYQTKERLVTVFASLAEHYFHFKIWEEGKRKDRCKDKILFHFTPSDFTMKIDRNASHRPSSNKLQRLIDMIMKLESETIETEVKKACQTIVRNLRKMQICNFAEDNMSAEDILLLQRLISMQTQKGNTKTLSENIETIRRQIASIEDTIF